MWSHQTQLVGIYIYICGGPCVLLMAHGSTKLVRAHTHTQHSRGEKSRERENLDLCFVFPTHCQGRQRSQQKRRELVHEGPTGVREVVERNTRSKRNGRRSLKDLTGILEAPLELLLSFL